MYVTYFKINVYIFIYVVKCQVFVMLVAGSLAVMSCKAAPHKAHSFQHFHGPVEGDGVKETWKDEHGHEDVDYKAHPKYEFSYGVKDHHTKDFHGQKEHRDGKYFIINLFMF